MAVVRPFPPNADAAERLRHAPVPPDPSTLPHPLVPTVFHERWWLETVTAGAFTAAEVRENGRVIGWWPYVLSRHRGFRVSVMPPLTHLLGPAVDAGGGSPNNQWLKRLGILRELAAQLPRVAHFSQTCHPRTPDVLGLQGAGFESFVQFSAEVAPVEEAALWRHLRDKTRNVIRRAQEEWQVADVDPGEFIRFYADNLGLAGDRSYFDVSRLGPLHDAAAGRGQARIAGVRDARGRLGAAVFYVWDRERMWYFLSTRDPRVASNGAVSLLVWTGLQEAARRRLTFDFDGIASAGAARFFSGFGATIRPRYAVWRRSAGYALFTSLLDIARRRSNRNPFTAP